MKFLRIKSKFLNSVHGDCDVTPSVAWCLHEATDITWNEQLLHQNPAGATDVACPEGRVTLRHIALKCSNGDGAPTETGNTTNTNTIYKDNETGKRYLIDCDGNACPICCEVEAEPRPIFCNHTEAGNGNANFPAIAIGEEWETSTDNTLGLPVGVVMVRRI